MALNNQALLDYIAAHPGAGRDDIRQHIARRKPANADAESRPELRSDIYCTGRRDLINAELKDWPSIVPQMNFA
jgi:hypothetical protein